MPDQTPYTYPSFDTELAIAAIEAAIDRCEAKVERLSANTGTRPSTTSADIAYEQIQLSRLRLQLQALPNPWMWMETQLTAMRETHKSKTMQADTNTLNYLLEADLMFLLRFASSMVLTQPHDKDGNPC